MRALDRPARLRPRPAGGQVAGVRRPPRRPPRARRAQSPRLRSQGRSQAARSGGCRSTDARDRRCGAARARGRPLPRRARAGWPQRAADDRALAAELPNGAKIVERTDAAGCQDRQRGGSGDLLEQIEVGAGERAVAGRARHKQSSDSRASAHRQASVSGSSGSACVHPSTATRPSQTSIATTSRSPRSATASPRKRGARAAVAIATRAAPAPMAVTSDSGVRKPPRRFHGHSARRPSPHARGVQESARRRQRRRGRRDAAAVRPRSRSAPRRPPGRFPRR
jgi:hypothetical protein